MVDISLCMYVSPILRTVVGTIKQVRKVSATVPTIISCTVQAIDNANSFYSCFLDSRGSLVSANYDHQIQYLVAIWH